jgi:hypothetical protein
MLRRTNDLGKVVLVSSMSSLMWIQPADLGGLFFACAEHRVALVVRMRS